MSIWIVRRIWAWQKIRYLNHKYCLNEDRWWWIAPKAVKVIDLTRAK